VPLGVDGGDETLHDGLVTATTAWSKLLVIALPAEGLAVFLVEPLSPKVLAAKRAEEVLRMPRTIQGPHHTLKGGGEMEEEGERERERRRICNANLTFNLQSNATCMFFAKYTTSEVVYANR
jgi:hypothetical protein